MARCPFKILLARSIMMKHKSVHTSFLHFSLGPPKHHSRWIVRIPHTKRLSKMAADAWPRRNSFEFHYRVKCTYLARAICIHYMSKMWQKRKSRALLLLKTTVPWRVYWSRGMSWRWLSMRKTTHSQLTLGGHGTHNECELCEGDVP